MILSLIRIGALLLALLPATSHALSVTIYCGDLPGCGSGFDDFLTSAVNVVLNYLPQYIFALAWTFVVIGGMYMVLNTGDESRYDAGKKTVIYALGGLAVGLFAERFIGFVFSEQYIDPSSPYHFGLQDTILGVLLATQRIIFTFFDVALFFAIIYHSVRLITSRGNEDQYQKAITGFFYSALGAIVLNLARMLTLAVCQFFELNICYPFT